MKKNIARLISLSIGILFFSPLIPTPYVHAQVAQCPVGWTCVPTASTSPATVTATGTPSLAITYNSARQESALTASFLLSVYGGNTGINVNQNGVGTVFTDQKGNRYDNLNSETIKITGVGSVATTTDTYGQALYVVPAGSTVTLQVTATVNPQQMFSGVYYASLASQIMVEVGTNGPSEFSLPIITNNYTVNTNTKAIIGEVSPYISSVSSPVALGQALTITGSRLNGMASSTRSLVFIDGSQFTASPVLFSIDGTRASLVIPSTMIAGSYHTLSIYNSTTGSSNITNFQITPSILSSSSEQILASLDASSPITSTVQLSTSSVTNMVPLAVFDLSSQNGPSTLNSLSVGMIINSNGQSVGPDRFFTNVFMKINGVMYAESSVVGQQVKFNLASTSMNLPANATIPITIYASVPANTTLSLNGSSVAVTLPLTGIIATDARGVTVPVQQGSIVGLLSGSTITFMTGGVPSQQPTVTITSSPSLALTYNSAQKESALTATFNVSIAAGNQTLEVYKNDASFNFVNQNTTYSNGISYIPSLVTTSTISSGTDSNGNPVWIIPAGQAANFKATAVANPAAMFAGTYSVQLSNLWMVGPTGTFAILNNIVPSLYSTNSVTIVGELSPYISSVTSPARQGQSVTVTGQRLNGGMIFIDGLVLSNVIVSGPVDGTSLTFTLPVSITTGAHSLTVNNSATGLSNSVLLNVSGVVLTGAPTISSISPTNGNGTAYDKVVINGSNFAQGDTIAVFMNGSTGVGTVTSASVAVLSANQMTVVMPALNPGIYSIQIGSPSGQSNILLYTVTPVNPPPATNLVLQSVSWSYLSGGSTYSDPRVNFGGTDSKPFNDNVTATKWCQAVPGKSYTSGISQLNWANPQDDYRYQWTGAQWKQNLGGDYVRDYVCSGTITPASSSLAVAIDPSSPQTGTVMTSPTSSTTNAIMGVFDIESQNAPSSLQNLSITLNESGASSIGSAFGQVQLKSGSTVLAYGTVTNPSSNSSSVTFSNFTLPLPTNAFVPLTISVLTNGPLNGVSAYVTLNISGTPAITANTQTFISSSVQGSGGSGSGGAGSASYGSASYTSFLSPAKVTANAWIAILNLLGSLLP